MKNIILISSILLGAGAIYGIVDLQQSSGTGELRDLYKDEPYNGKGSNTAFVKKELTAEDYSRGPIEKVAVDEPTRSAARPDVVNAAPVKHQKDPTPQELSKMEDHQEAIAVRERSKDETEAMLVYPAAGVDSVMTTDVDKNKDKLTTEEKEIRMSMFSRAPIRKKMKKEEVVLTAKVDSVAHQ